MKVSKMVTEVCSRYGTGYDENVWEIRTNLSAGIKKKGTNFFEGTDLLKYEDIDR